MLVIMEGLVMCFVLLLICVVLIRNGAVGGVIFYEEDVKKRVVELGYITEKKIKRNNAAIVTAALFIPLLTVVPYMVYGINGAEGFWSGFWQMTAILWIMGLFDRLFIDWYWVEHTKAWFILGTEDLMPYIPLKTKIGKWMGTVVGFPLIAALIAGVVAFFV